jgi:hypothetical protein
MKAVLGIDISGTYIFNPTAKTITFSGLASSIFLQNIYLITNVTRNVIIYNFADTATGEQSFSNNVLTLTYDTSAAGMASTDVLQIILDVDQSIFFTKSTSTDDQIVLLRRIVKILEMQSAVDPQNRQRITIDAITAALTNANAIPVSQTTATNLNATAAQPTASALNATAVFAATANLPNLLGRDQQLIADWARTSYNTGIRNQLNFS